MPLLGTRAYRLYSISFCSAWSEIVLCTILPALLVIYLASAMAASQASASDDAGLLGNLFPSQRGEGAVVAADAGSAKRLCLRRADYVASQMLQPHGPSAIEKAPLGGLWQVVKQGNKWTEFYSYLAHPDPVRQGVAISQCAQVLKHAIAHFRESRVEHIMKQSIYKKVKQQTDAIFPHLEVLDGGYHQNGKTSGFAKLGRTITTRTEEEVEAACKAIFEWLKKDEDAFRAYLQIMSGAGVVYAAQCEEKVLRAYVTCGGVKEADFANAAKKRLCTDACEDLVAATQDDKALRD